MEFFNTGRSKFAWFEPVMVCAILLRRAGIDPYTRVVSDIYQDLFGEGSFIGKGIYNVDVFNQVLDGDFLKTGF